MGWAASSGSRSPICAALAEDGNRNPQLKSEPARKLKLMFGRISLIFVTLLFALPGIASAQTICPPTPEFTPCDLVFDIPSAKSDHAIDHPIDLAAEFR